MLVVRGARLHAGLRSDPVDDAVLVCEGARIVYAGRAADAPPTGDATVIDAGGLALIPGLIDCHVHVCFDGQPDFEREAGEMTPERAAVKAAVNARRALDAGITTVRDLGGIGLASLAAAWAQGEGIITGARIISAGQALTITGGHGHYIGREVDTAEEMIKGVRTLKKLGAECIKLIATGGVLTRGIGAQRSAFSADEIAAAVAEAHEAGLRVAAHAIGSNGILAAVQGGVDSIEHGCFLTDQAIKLMADNPTWLVATLVAPHQIVHGGEGVPDFAVEKSEEVGRAQRESFRRATEAGVRIAAGTDAGTPFNPHGALWRELWLMSENGMGLDRVLVSATSEAAALLGIEETTGSLVAGKAADFVLLDGDPLSDVTAYQRPALVAQGGTVVVDRR